MHRPHAGRTPAQPAGRDPQREPARGEPGLDVAAVGVCALPEYHRSMTSPLTLSNSADPNDSAGPILSLDRSKDNGYI
jgi:hypothetical protein